MNGPCPTPLRHPTKVRTTDRLVRDPKGPGTGVRPILFHEYARLKGVPLVTHEGPPTQEELRVLLQAVPVGAATSALRAGQQIREREAERKAGVNRNEEEVQVMAQMRAWLRAWREGRLPGREEELAHAPRPVLPTESKVGGYDTEAAIGSGLRELAESLGLWTGKITRATYDTKVGGPWDAEPGAYEARLRSKGEALLMEALADGTSKTYRAAWDQWTTYARVRGIEPFLEGQTRKEIRQDEEEILLYMVHLGITMSRAAGTVKAKLFALRQMHIVAGYPDPLQGKPRLRMALKGLERRRGPGRRKLRTTPGMLKWIRTQLRPETCANDAVPWAGLMLAFFFLMRVGEYAHSGHWDRKKVLTPSDLKGQLEGQPVVEYRRADEVLLRFKSSKADLQEGAGATRNHYRTHERLCPVEALELLQKHLGHRMTREPHEPLLRWEDGSPLTRDHIQAILERGAVAVDLPPDRFRSHSLRIGGATALYHVYHDVEIIKRCGRWSSSAFQGYLWEANETARGVAARMARDETTLHIDRPLAPSSARGYRALATADSRVGFTASPALEPARLTAAPRLGGGSPRPVGRVMADHVDLAFGRRAQGRRDIRQLRRRRHRSASGTTSKAQPPSPPRGLRKQRQMPRRLVQLLRHGLDREHIPHRGGWAALAAVTEHLRTNRAAIIAIVQEDPDRFEYDVRTDELRATRKHSYPDDAETPVPRPSPGPSQAPHVRAATSSGRASAPSTTAGRTRGRSRTPRREPLRVSRTEPPLVRGDQLLAARNPRAPQRLAAPSRPTPMVPRPPSAEQTPSSSQGTTASVRSESVPGGAHRPLRQASVRGTPSTAGTRCGPNWESDDGQRTELNVSRTCRRTRCSRSIFFGAVWPRRTGPSEWQRPRPRCGCGVRLRAPLRQPFRSFSARNPHALRALQRGGESARDRRAPPLRPHRRQPTLGYLFSPGNAGVGGAGTPPGHGGCGCGERTHMRSDGSGDPGRPRGTQVSQQHVTAHVGPETVDSPPSGHGPAPPDDHYYDGRLGRFHLRRSHHRLRQHRLVDPADRRRRPPLWKASHHHPTHHLRRQLPTRASRREAHPDLPKVL